MQQVPTLPYRSVPGSVWTHWVLQRPLTESTPAGAGRQTNSSEHWSNLSQQALNGPSFKEIRTGESTQYGGAGLSKIAEFAVGVTS